MKLKGFTLVELIIVLAIIGVISGLLVPNIVNYVISAKYQDANTVARIVYNSAAQYCVEYKVNDVHYVHEDGTEVMKEEPYVAADAAANGYCYKSFAIDEFAPDTANSVQLSSLKMAAEKYISDKSAVDTSGSSAVVVVAPNGTIVRAFWSETSDSRYVGAFPNPIDPDDPDFDNMSEVLTWAP